MSYISGKISCKGIKAKLGETAEVRVSTEGGELEIIGSVSAAFPSGYRSATTSWGPCYPDIAYSAKGLGITYSQTSYQRKNTPKSTWSPEWEGVTAKYRVTFPPMTKTFSDVLLTAEAHISHHISYRSGGEYSNEGTAILNFVYDIPPPAKTTVDPNYLELTWKAGTVQVSVSDNRGADIKVESYPRWISSVRLVGKNGDTSIFEIKYPERTGGGSNYGDVVFKGSTTASVRVDQKRQPSISLTPDSGTLPQVGGTITSRVYKPEGVGELSVFCNKDWVDAKLVDGNLQITVGRFTERTEWNREATIYVRADDTKEAEFSLSQNHPTIVDVYGAKGEGDMTASTADSWITIDSVNKSITSDETGEKTGTVTFGQTGLGAESSANLTVELKRETE